MMRNDVVTMAVDTKKYRIRIHKALLRRLGEPKYIQLLVNPVHGIVAVKTVETGAPCGEIHKVQETRIQSDNSYEIYSRTLIERLRVLEPGIKDCGSYRLAGTVVAQQKMAVFPLKTLRKA